MATAKKQDEPAIISWKAFWSIFGAVVTAAIGVLSHVTNAPLLLAVVVAGGTGAIFVVGARWVVHGAKMFAAVHHEGRQEIVRLLSVGAVVHVLWVAAYQFRPDLWGGMLIALVILSAIEYWTARGHEYKLTQLVRTPSKELQKFREDQKVEDQTGKALSHSFKRAGFDWLQILRWEPIGTPETYGVRVFVRIPSRLAQKSAEGKASSATLSPESAEPIAIGLAEVLGTEILSDWVQVQKQPAAGTYAILMVNQDVMARVYPYEDDLTWSTIRNPRWHGNQMDGAPHLARIDRHGQFSGQSQSGKSSLVDTEIAQATKSEDCVLMVGGVQKLYNLVAGWLEPYMNQDVPLPFELVVNGQSDVVDLLVGLMSLTRWRQRQPMSKRRNFVNIIFYHDEASFTLENRSVKGSFEGQMLTASQLTAQVAKASASALIFQRLISQRGVNTHFGDQGGDITANAGTAAAFRTKDQADIGRMMGLDHYKLPVPRHRGEYWYTDEDTEPIQLKSPYIQSMDPSQPRLHAGLTVSEVAWSRRNFVRELDAPSAEYLAEVCEVYANRHKRMTPEFLAYLTGVDETPMDELGTEGRAAQAATSAYLDRMLAEPAPTTVAASTGEAFGGLLKMSEHRPRAERIEAIVRSADRPLKPADILTALREAGDQAASDQVVTNALTGLVKDGKLSRPERGLYASGS
jgi:hypothetical protein